MNKAQLGDTVAIHLTGTLADGTPFTDTDEDAPLQFTLGGNHVLPALQDAIVGMSPGESKIVAVPADRAYGRYRRDLLRIVDRDRLPRSLDLKVGQRLNVRRPDGSTMQTTVAGLCEASVMLDANHPLAGKDLVFEVLFLGVVHRGTPEVRAEPAAAKAAPEAPRSPASRNRRDAGEPKRSQVTKAMEAGFSSEPAATHSSTESHVPA